MFTSSKLFSCTFSSTETKADRTSAKEVYVSATASNDPAMNATRAYTASRQCTPFSEETEGVGGPSANVSRGRRSSVVTKWVRKKRGISAAHLLCQGEFPGR